VIATPPSSLRQSQRRLYLLPPSLLSRRWRRRFALHLLSPLLGLAWPAHLRHQSGSTGSATPAPPGPAPLPADPAAYWQAALERMVPRRGPNRRLGLAQAHYLAGTAGGYRAIFGGLNRYRIPAEAIDPQHGRILPHFFPGDESWWIERLRDAGVPQVAVLETDPALPDSAVAGVAAQVASRHRPQGIILGNELNIDPHWYGSRADSFRVIGEDERIRRYLEQWRAVHQAVKAVSPSIRLFFYGEAHYGDLYDGGRPVERAFLRRLVSACIRRGDPLPDGLVFHYYGPVWGLPQRAAQYMRFARETGIPAQVSCLELGPPAPILDREEEPLLRRRAATHPGFESRYDELRAQGWLTEEEQAALVAHQLAVAAGTPWLAEACLFSATDVPDDPQHTGLVGMRLGLYRPRPALEVFLFLQRLLNELILAELILPTENNGVAELRIQRDDGLEARVLWSEALPDDVRAPQREVLLPALAVALRADGTLLQAPQRDPAPLTLPGSTTPQCGGPAVVVI
jgi:hypothetical protein